MPQRIEAALRRPASAVEHQHQRRRPLRPITRRDVDQGARLASSPSGCSPRGVVAAALPGRASRRPFRASLDGWTSSEGAGEGLAPATTHPAGEAVSSTPSAPCKSLRRVNARSISTAPFIGVPPGPCTQGHTSPERRRERFQKLRTAGGGPSCFEEPGREVALFVRERLPARSRGGQLLSGRRSPLAPPCWTPWSHNLPRRSSASTGA